MGEKERGGKGERGEGERQGDKGLAVTSRNWPRNDLSQTVKPKRLNPPRQDTRAGQAGLPRLRTEAFTALGFVFGDTLISQNSNFRKF
ncbi:hypothetical protein E2C01_002181 [Portunus trituberculatus]|uniref:Uncharacterized protein n=1 Tax=Portunus trituberculatus TaxID=210409 RepID=A0A5B7CMG1_PORTR|nr:hypothetical protein [Portunus trituberculatus]